MSQGVAVSMLPAYLQRDIGAAAANATDISILRSLSDAGHTALALQLGTAGARVRVVLATQEFSAIANRVRLGMELGKTLVAAAEDVFNVVADTATVVGVLFAAPSLDNLKATLSSIQDAVLDVRDTVYGVMDDVAVQLNASFTDAGPGSLLAMACSARRAKGECGATDEPEESACELLHSKGITAPQCCDELLDAGIDAGSVCEPAPDCVALHEGGEEVPKSCCPKLWLQGIHNDDCIQLPDCTDIVDAAIGNGTQVPATTTLPPYCCVDQRVAAYVASHPVCKASSWFDGGSDDSGSGATGNSTMSVDSVVKQVRCALSRLVVNELGDTGVHENGELSAAGGRRRLREVTIEARKAELERAVDRLRMAGERVVRRGLGGVDELATAAAVAMGAFDRHAGVVVHHACAVEAGYGAWLAALASLSVSQLDFIAEAAARQLFSSAEEVMAAMWSDLQAGADPTEQLVLQLGVSLAWRAASQLVSQDGLSPELAALMAPAESVQCEAPHLAVAEAVEQATASSTCATKQYYAELRGAVAQIAGTASSKAGRMVSAAVQTAVKLSTHVSRVISALELLARLADAVSPTDLLQDVGTAVDTVGRAVWGMVNGEDFPTASSAASADIADGTTVGTIAGHPDVRQALYSIPIDVGIDANLGDVPGVADIAAAVERANAAREDFAAVAKVLGGMSDLPTIAEKLAAELAPLAQGFAQQLLNGVLGSSSSPSTDSAAAVLSAAAPAAGVRLTDLGGARLDRISSLVGGALERLNNMLPAVRNHASVATLATMSFDDHEAWLKRLRSLLRLAKVASVAQSAKQMASVLSTIVGVGELVVNHATATGPPTPSTFDAWFSFAADDLVPAVTAAIGEVSDALAASGVTMTPVNLDWFDAALANVANVIASVEEKVATCVGGCPTQEQRDLLATMLARCNSVEASFAFVRQQVVAQVNSGIALGKSEAAAQADAVTADVVELLQPVTASLSALVETWSSIDAAMESALETVEVLEPLQDAFQQLQDAAAGALAFQRVGAKVVDALARAERPMRFAVVVGGLVTSTFDPLPSGCVDAEAFGGEVASVVAARAAGMIATLDAVSGPDAAAVREQLSKGFGAGSPATELKQLLDVVGNALSAGAGTDAKIVLNEIRLLVLQALLAQLCASAREVASFVYASIDVVTASASVASAALGGNFDGAADAASNELLPALGGLRQTALGPLLDEWAARGRAALQDVIAKATALAADLSSSPLLDAAKCAAAGVELGSCPGVHSYAAASAGALLKLAAEEVHKAVPNELISAIPLNGDVTMTGEELLNAILSSGSVSLDQLLHAASVLSVARYAAETLQEATFVAEAEAGVAAGESTGSEIVAEAYADALPAVRALMKPLQQLRVFAAGGGIQPVLWGLDGMSGFFEQVAALIGAVSDLASALLEGGLMNMNPTTFGNLLDQVLSVAEGVRDSASAGLIAPHLVATALRAELGSLLDSHTRSVTNGDGGVLSVDALAAVKELDALLAPIIAPGIVESMVPSERTKLDDALSAALSKVGSAAPVVSAITAAMSSSFALMRVLPNLDGVLSALEAIRDSQAMEAARLVFDVVNVIQDGGSLGDAATLVLERLAEQAQPLIVNLALPSSSVVSDIVSAATEAADDLSAAASGATVPTLALGAFDGPAPWAVLRLGRLEAALRAVAEDVPELATALGDKLASVGLVQVSSSGDGVSAQVQVPTLDQVLQLLDAVKDSALALVLLLKEVVAAAAMVDVELPGVLPPSAETVVTLLKDTFKVRCAVSCDFDLQLSRAMRIASAAGNVLTSLKGLGRASSLNEVLGAGMDILESAVNELRSAGLDRLEAAAPLEPAPTSNSGAGLFADAVQSFVAAIDAGDVVAVSSDAVDPVAELRASLVSLASGLSESRFFSTFAGMRQLSRRAGSVRDALHKVATAGFDLAAFRAEAEAAGKLDLAAAAWTLDEFTPVMEAWLEARVGSTGVNVAAAAISALNVLAQQVATVDELAGLTLDEFADRGSDLSRQLSGSLLTFLGDLTVAEMGSTAVQPILDVAREFEVAVESSAGSSSSATAAQLETMQTAVNRAFRLSGEVADALLVASEEALPLPLTSAEQYSLDTAVAYNTVLNKLSSWRDALGQVVTAVREAIPVEQADHVAALVKDAADAATAARNTCLDSASSTAEELACGVLAIGEPVQVPSGSSAFATVLARAMEALLALGSVSDERFDQGPRLVASGSIELVTLMGYIVEVARLIESGADYTSLRRLASHAMEELSKRLQEAVLKQADSIVASFTSYIDDTVAKYGGGDDSNTTVAGANPDATNPSRSASAMSKITGFMSKVSDFQHGPLAKIQTAVDRANVAVDKVREFRNGITGVVAKKLEVIDVQVAYANSVFDQVSDMLDMAIDFTSSTEELEVLANRVVTIVVTELDSRVTIVIDTFDVLIIEIDNVETLVLTAISNAKDRAKVVVADTQKALFALGGGFLGKLSDKLEDVKAFLESKAQQLDAWKQVAHMAVEITLLLRDLDAGDTLQLGRLASAFATVRQGVEYVEAKLAQLQAMRDTVDDIFSQLTDVSGWVNPWIDSVPAEQVVKTLFDSLRTRVNQVKRQAIRMKDDLFDSMTDLVERAISEVLEILDEALSPIAGGLKFVRDAMHDAKQSVDSVFNLVDRREYLFEQMENVLGYLDPPLDAIATVQAFVEKFMGGAKDAANTLSGFASRRLLETDGCTLDLSAVRGFDAAASAVDAATTLAGMLPSLGKMSVVGQEIGALVGISSSQQCVEGSTCGLSVIAARLEEVLEILNVFESGLVSLRRFGEELPVVASAVTGMGKCLSPVPAALDAVRAFADDFMSGRLFGIDVEGGMATILAEAQALQTRALKLTVGVDEVLKIFRTHVLSVVNTVNAGFDQVSDTIDVLQSGVFWAKKTAESLTEVQDVKEKLGEYIESLDIAGLMRQQLSVLMDHARSFLRMIIIRTDGAFATLLDRAGQLLSNMRSGRNLIMDKAGQLLDFATAINEQIGLGKLVTDIRPWYEMPYCSDDTVPEGACLRQEERSSYLYRNLVYPALYTRFWYETIPPLNDPNRMNRATLPGLYESFYPRGIEVLDEHSYLLTFQPVGANAGEPSLVVRMEKKKNGGVMRIYQLYEEDGVTPFSGTVKDVAVSGRDNVFPNLPYFVWTGDDTRNPETNFDLADYRNNLLVCFKYDDFKFHETSGKPLAVRMHRSYRIEVKPAGLSFVVDGSYDSLYIVEYAEPVLLDQDGRVSDQNQRSDFGTSPATDKSDVGRKGKRKGKRKPPKSKTTKEAKTKPAQNQQSRQRVSTLSFNKEDDLLPVVPLGVHSLHCNVQYQQCGWAIRQDLDPNDGLPDAATSNVNMDGRSPLVPDLAFFVGEGVRGFSLADQLGRKYAIVERCSFAAGYSCRLEFHRYDDLQISTGGVEVIFAGHLHFKVYLLDPGIPPDQTTVASGGDGKNKATKRESAKAEDKKARAGDKRKKRASQPKGKGRRSKATKGSVASKKKKNGKKPDTSVEQRNLGESSTAASIIRLPTGASGMAYRTSNTENFLMFLFTSAAEPNINHVFITGGDVEDSVHLMWLPGLASLPPSVMENMLYVKYKLRYKISPRCLIPIGEECKKDKKAQKNAKSKPGGKKTPTKRPRKLFVTEPSHEIGIGDREAGLVPMSPAAQSFHNHAYARAGVIPAWGEDAQPSRGQIASVQHRQHEARSLAASPHPQHARRLETRGAKYADQSRCLTADFELLPPTSHVLWVFYSIFFVGPVPCEISAQVALVYYIDFAITVCIADKTVIGTLIPGVALEGSIFGGLTVPFIAKAGIQITVRLMDITLLPQASLSVKNGLSVCLAFDLSLIPVSIDVAGFIGFFICIKFCEVCFSVFGGSICFPLPCGLTFCPPIRFPIWHWGLAAIKMNIFVICNTPPDSTPPETVDAFITATQTDAETLSVAYGGFRDEESNVKGFTACLGTTPGGQEIAECRDVELDKTVVFPFLELAGEDGRMYYASVLARNGEGLESLLTDRIVIDDSGPVISRLDILREHDNVFTFDPLIKHSDMQAIRMAVRIVEDNPEEHIQIAVVETAVGLGPDSYQDAAEWTEVLQDFNTNGGSADFSISGLLLQHAVQYYVHVRTTNTIGRQTISTAQTVVYVDLTPGIPGPISVHNGASIMLEYLLEWMPLSDGNPRYSATAWTVSPMWSCSDPESEIVAYHVLLLDANGNPDHPIDQAFLDDEETTVTFEGFSLPHLFEYEVKVRCKTDANLWSERVSDRVMIDLTRPQTRQVLDLAAEATEGPLAIDPDPDSEVGQGLFTPPLLTPAQVTATDLDFVTELDELRVAFAAWDEDSGIKHVMVAAGPAPGSPAILKWTPVEVRGKRQVRVPLPQTVALQRHLRYYVSVSAVNGAGLLALWASSDGIMIDDTPPVCVEYRVRDGTHRLLDSEYQADTASLTAQWRSALFDLESLIDHFEVTLEDIDFGTVIAGPMNAGKAVKFTFKELELEHNQRVRTVVSAYNRAGAVLDCATNGLLIDTTGPVPTPSDAGVVWDGNNALFGYEGMDLQYTWATRSAFAAWTQFRDPESRINNYWLWTETMEGAVLSTRRWVHPLLTEWTMPIPTQSHGSQYRIVLRAVNGASSYKDYRSDGIEVDVTPPYFTTPVEFRIDGKVGLEPHIIASEDTKLSIVVRAEDPESGILRCRYALGTYPDGSDLTGVVTAEVAAMNASSKTVVSRTRGGNQVCYFDGTCEDVPASNHSVTTDILVDRVLNEEVALLNHFTFYAWVVCINNADLFIRERAPRSLIVDARAPSAGLVFDGLQGEREVDFSPSNETFAGNWRWWRDHETGIRYYEAALGTKPGLTDTHDWVRTDLKTFVFFSFFGADQLQHAQKYFVTVRATDNAGHQTTSASDGVVIDITHALEGVIEHGLWDTEVRKWTNRHDLVLLRWAGIIDPEVSCAATWCANSRLTVDSCVFAERYHCVRVRAFQPSQR